MAGTRTLPVLALLLFLPSAAPALPDRYFEARELEEAEPDRAVAIYTELLRYEEEAYRQWSAEGLGRLWRRAGPAVPELIEAIADPDRRLSHHGVEALWRIGAAAVPGVTAGLAHGDPWVRRCLAEVLYEIGPAARDAVPALRRACRDPDGGVRRHAALALARIAPGDPACLPELLLRDGSPGLSYEADNAIEEARAAFAPVLADTVLRGPAKLRVLAVRELRLDGGDDPETVAALGSLVPDLRDAFGGEDPVVRAWAAVLLAWAEPSTEGLAEVLAGALGSDEPGLPLFAARALGALGPWGRPAAAGLLAALEAGEPEVGRAAARALPRVGAPADVAVPALLAILAPEEPDSRKPSVGMALADYGEAARDAVPLLVRELNGETEWRAVGTSRKFRVRGVVWPAEVLEALGPVAAPAAPDLVRALTSWGDSHPPFLYHAAVAALRAIGGPAVPALVEALDDENGGTAGDASVVLVALGPQAAGAGPALAKAVEEGRGGGAAILALARLRPEDPDARAALAGLVEKWRSRSPENPERLFGHLDDRDARLAPVLRSLLEVEDPWMRLSCARALLRMGEGGEEAVGVCVEVLAEHGLPWRPGGLMRDLGPDGRALLPLLLRMIEGEDRRRAGYAAEAVGLLDPLPDEALPGLVRCVERHIEPAIQTLALYGPAAEPARAALEDARREGSRSTMRLARLTLRRLDGR